MKLSESIWVSDLKGDFRKPLRGFSSLKSCLHPLGSGLCSSRHSCYSPTICSTGQYREYKRIRAIQTMRPLSQIPVILKSSRLFNACRYFNDQFQNAEIKNLQRSLFFFWFFLEANVRRRNKISETKRGAGHARKPLHLPLRNISCT